MVKRQNPFSLYDFLGYFIPGAITLYLLIFAFFHSSKMKVDNKATLLEALQETIQFFSNDIYIPFIILAYILGHFLSFVSSITIEKFSIWLHGYPSKYLIKVKPYGYFHTKEHNKRRIIGRLTVALILFPIVYFEIIIGICLNLKQLYIKSTNELSIKIIKKGVARLYEGVTEIQITDTNAWFQEQSFFRLCYHYALENSANHTSKMQNYVALFGFTRTIAFVFTCFFWLIMWHMINGRLGITLSFSLPIISGVISYIFYIAFNKFYRRFSLETFMAMVVLVADNKRLAVRDNE